MELILIMIIGKLIFIFLFSIYHFLMYIYVYLYLFLCSNNSHHDSIMADMLAGQWYASVCKLPRVGLLL